MAGQIHLEKLKDLDATKKVIEEVEKTLDNADGVTAVHGRFYLLASQYYRIQGDHAQYYRTALRYLGCIELDTLTEETKMQHAFFLGLAALLGKFTIVKLRLRITFDRNFRRGSLQFRGTFGASSASVLEKHGK